MVRVLIIPEETAAARALAQQAAEHDVVLAVAESVCDAVRTLGGTPVALIVLDHRRLRLDPPSLGAVFDHVAPGVPVAVAVAADLPPRARARLEASGVSLIPSPPDLQALLALLRSPAGCGFESPVYTWKRLPWWPDLASEE